jgi:hypothetical protein
MVGEIAKPARKRKRPSRPTPSRKGSGTMSSARASVPSR